MTSHNYIYPMARSDKERQALRREKMRLAGYKQVLVWVPKESEGKAIKQDRKLFLKHIESLTIGWSKTKLNRLFRDVIKFITEKIKREDI